jgi:2-polyprenyl-3-methyl-5-hydroxy-6-metoxy-1,4-benzoquinol methylase
MTDSTGSPQTQTWDPERYARNARFVADLGAPVVELLAPRPGERILDVGCGDGALTEKLVAMGCDVVGVDSSKAQVEAARRRHLEVRLMDGQHLTSTIDSTPFSAMPRSIGCAIPTRSSQAFGAR